MKRAGWMKANSFEHEQRGIGGGNDRLALAGGAGAAIAVAQPAAGMAGMNRGQWQGGGHGFIDRTELERRASC